MEKISLRKSMISVMEKNSLQKSYQLRSLQELLDYVEPLNKPNLLLNFVCLSSITLRRA